MSTKTKTTFIIITELVLLAPGVFVSFPLTSFHNTTWHMKIHDRFLSSQSFKIAT